MQCSSLGRCILASHVLHTCTTAINSSCLYPILHTIDWLKAPFFPLHDPAHESWEMALLFRWHHTLQCHCNVNADTHLYKVNKRNTRPQMPQKHFSKQRGDHTGTPFPAFIGSVSYSERGDVQARPPPEVHKPFAT